jgi:hypothetical protein
VHALFNVAETGWVESVRSAWSGGVSCGAMTWRQPLCRVAREFPAPIIEQSPRAAGRPKPRRTVTRAGRVGELLR